VVVVWSLGEVVVMNFIRDHGDSNLAGAVLVDAVTHFSPELFGDGNAALVQLLQSPDAAIRSADTRRFISACFAVPPKPAELDLMLARAGVLQASVHAEISRVSLDHDDEVLRSIRVPTLVIHGAKDGLTLPLMAQRTVSLVPGARPSLYADAGHAPFFDDSARFNDEFASFVREANRDASKKVVGVEKNKASSRTNCHPEIRWIAGQSAGTLKAELLRQKCTASGTWMYHSPSPRAIWRSTDNTNWTINLVPPIASEHSANAFATKTFLRVPKGYGARLVQARNLLSVESDQRSSEVRVQLRATVRPEDGNDSFGAHPCDRDLCGVALKLSCNSNHDVKQGFVVAPRLGHACFKLGRTAFLSLAVLPCEDSGRKRRVAEYP
jgi:hypothetical protein